MKKFFVFCFLFFASALTCFSQEARIRADKRYNIRDDGKWDICFLAREWTDLNGYYHYSRAAQYSELGRMIELELMIFGGMLGYEEKVGNFYDYFMSQPKCAEWEVEFEIENAMSFFKKNSHLLALESDFDLKDAGCLLIEEGTIYSEDYKTDKELVSSKIYLINLDSGEMWKLTDYF